jgi:hypothetical protein
MHSVRFSVFSVLTEPMQVGDWHFQEVPVSDLSVEGAKAPPGTRTGR